MKKRVLITVKTYPALSETYNELVCTAGLLDDGSWIRLYPIQFRMLNNDQQYPKYSYIEVEVERNARDHRIESYRPIDIRENLKVIGSIGTENEWTERRAIVLQNATDDFSALLERTKSEHISLAVYKPAEVLDFVWEPVEREWDKEKLAKVKGNLRQLNLFEEQEATKIFEVVKKLPYKFSYIFKDIEGKVHKLMIEDWELGVLFWKCVNYGDDEATACDKVKNKFYDWMIQRDLYFYLGTTLAHPNTFIIIGAFYPPKQTPQQPSLFD